MIEKDNSNLNENHLQKLKSLDDFLEENFTKEKQSDINDKAYTVILDHYFDKLTPTGKVKFINHVNRFLNEDITGHTRILIDLAYLAISDDGKILEEDQDTANKIKKIEEYLNAISPL